MPSLFMEPRSRWMDLPSVRSKTSIKVTPRRSSWLQAMFENDRAFTPVSLVSGLVATSMELIEAVEGEMTEPGPRATWIATKATMHLVQALC